jgi:hypothetical protein
MLFYASHKYQRSIIVLMMEAVDSSETFVNLHDTTWRSVSEICRLQVFYALGGSRAP